LQQTLALAFLAFDATATSVTDVGYPIDVIIAEAQSRITNQQRFEAVDLEPVAQWWHQTLAVALNDFPLKQFNSLFDFPNR